MREVVTPLTRSSDATVDIAVIGAGYWGPRLLRALDRVPGTRVRHVVDRDEQRLASAIGDRPDVEWHTELGPALADPAVTAVVVATPASTHHLVVRAALQAGKHVLVEKPMTTSSSAADELCTLADTVARVLMVGHVYLYNGTVRWAKAQVSSGALGPVRYLSMVRTNRGPVRADVTACWDLASHDVAIAIDLLGAAPVAASATGRCWSSTGMDDVVFATLRFPGPDGSEVLAGLHASWLSGRRAREVTIVGVERTLTFDEARPDDGARVVDAADVVVASTRMHPQEPLVAELGHFVACIRDGSTPLTCGRRGTEVVRVLEAIDRSARSSGREVDIEWS